jgi:hypothetical protein
MAYSSITKPTDYFNTVIYSGSNSNQSITGVGFQPDWVWIKNRSSTPSHMLNDAVRGAGKQINSDSSNAELDRTYFQSFDSDGFSLEGNVSDYNQNSSNFVSWNWLGANGTASNTDGSITSTVSANTTSGFSAVSYTGTGSNATIGHGLGVVPKMIIIKNRSQSNGWITGHEKLDATNPWHKYVELNSTSAVADLNTIWNDTAPTSSLFTVGTEAAVNNSGNNFIAYCFAEKKGYSKFGIYTGNANAEGTFIHTGFKPAFIMLKPTSTTGNWFILDNKRNSFNVMDQYIRANLSNADATFSMMDFVSNGVKIITSDASINGSGVSYIYMAFAENPFVGNDSGTAVPVVAR